MSDKLQIALAEGDGIGPEITKACLHIFEAAGCMDHLDFVPVEMGEAVFETGNTRGVTDEAMQTVETLGLLYKGPMGTPTGGGGKSIEELQQAVKDVHPMRTYGTPDDIAK